MAVGEQLSDLDTGVGPALVQIIVGETRQTVSLGREYFTVGHLRFHTCVVGQLVGLCVVTKYTLVVLVAFKASLSTRRRNSIRVQKND